VKFNVDIGDKPAHPEMDISLSLHELVCMKPLISAGLTGTHIFAHYFVVMKASV
jgi:hypothetical protein